MLILYIALQCATPTTGDYQVSYVKVSGTCPNFKSHKQFLVFPNNGTCKQPLQITKSKWPYTATFDGEVIWDSKGTNLLATGKVEVKSIWGGACQGFYRATLKQLN